MELKLLIDKGENRSGESTLNYLANYDKIYITDNHLAAFWCWLQLDLKMQYSLMHIDRHYDLKPYNEEVHNKILEVRKNPSIKIHDLIKIVNRSNNDQVLKWDNYINLFSECFPNFFTDGTFITQKKGPLNFNYDYEEKDFHEISSRIVTKDKSILNLDLDYFFSVIENNRTIQSITDDYINHIADWIYDEYDNFAQIVICLSPECSISWDASKRIANIILNRYKVSI